MSSGKVILGVDPGSNVTGYSIVLAEGRSLNLVVLGQIRTEKFDDHYDKLSRIFHRISEVIDSYNPHAVAVEAPFYGKNAQSMLKLGRAQGMAIAAALQKHIPVFEYSAKKVKQSVTGNGNASKEQVAYMLPHLISERSQDSLKAAITKGHLDATDSLAVAVCHHIRITSTVAEEGTKYSSWEAYVRSNPGKLAK